MPSTIGIIYPPPEVRSIVDKTASFVARNGPEFEEKIRQNEISNPKFNFLNSSDPYHAYYQHKVKEIAEGGSKPTPVEPTPSTSSSSAAPSQTQSIQSNLQKMNLSSKTQDTQTKIIEQMIILKDPPSEFEFILDAPSIMPLDIDVIKLTAQFVARNGRPFLSGLMNKEQRNPMFDFLKPQHSHFSYFTKLVDQYTKVLLPQKDLVDKMKKEIANPFGILKSVAYRVEWEKAQQKEKAKEEEAAEKERVAYAQIDWHDFVVVETVDYQPNEIGNFPPPTTPQDVGARIVAQERFEGSGEGTNIIDINGRILIDRIIDEESRVELSELSAKQHNMMDEIKLAPPVSSANDKNVDEVAMDEDSDQEGQVLVPKPPKEVKKIDLPLPPNPENVIIRKDYDPKAKQTIAKPTAGETYFKSPLTGELIPASSMSEHMRISMLDPRWIEQRQKEKRERDEKEEVLASGMSIEMNLKRLAEYRSDMFGSGAEEAIIGRKLGSSGANEDDKRVDEASTWDGHSNSMEKTSKRAMTGITLEDQIKAIHASQGLVEEDVSKIGPSIPKPATISTQIVTSAPASLNRPGTISQPAQPVQTIVSNYKLLNVPVPAIVKPPVQAQSQPQTIPQSVITPTEVTEEPATKRLKTAEELLIPEADYLAQYGQYGPVKFYVVIPSVPDKPEWNLNGQTISLTMTLSETVANIKSKLFDLLTIPIAKQKLQLDTMFIKDTNTLAYYNVSSESVVHLQLKERGGRKK